MINSPHLDIHVDDAYKRHSRHNSAQLNPPQLNNPFFGSPPPSSTIPQHHSQGNHAIPSYGGSFTTGSSPVGRQPSYRRHGRKRSSTIFVQARPTPPPEEPDVNRAAPVLLKGATTLAAAQVLSKLLAFALNQLLIRFLGSRDLGAASQLELLLTTSLSLSREALRLASQRQSFANKRANITEYTTDGRAVLGTVLGAYQETVNLGWLAAFIGACIVFVSATFLYGYNNTWPHSALFVTCLAALIELSVEPCFLIMQLKLQFSQRARAESIANVVRVCVVALTLVVFKTTPFLGFAYGHLFYALTLASLYLKPNLAAAHEAGYHFVPAKVWSTQRQDSAVYIGEQLWKTSWELGVQQIIKFFLTEGDKLAVGLMTTLEEQGEYALAANYGSLLARMLFLPVEDTLRGYFTQVLAKPSTPAPSSTLGSPIATATKKRYSFSGPSVSPVAPSKSKPASVSVPSSPFLGNDQFNQRDIGMRQSSSPTTSTSSSSPTSSSSESDSERPFMSEQKHISSDGILTLTRILRAYTYLGILAAGFGPLVSGYLLSFVVRTSVFGNAAHVLAAYACYIPILAWNGSLDALVQSVASLDTLRKQGFLLAGVAVCFVVLTYIFVTIMKMGAVGLVWAQIIGMSLRTLWALHFTTEYFGKGYGWLKQCVPDWWVTLTASVAVCIARFKIGEARNTTQFLIIVALAGIVACAGVFAERKQFIILLGKIRGRKSEHPDSKKYE